MTSIRTAGAWLVAASLVGCRPDAGAPSAAPDSKVRSVADAKGLIVGRWDEVPERPAEKTFSREEFTRDGKWRFWFLKVTPAGLKTLEGGEPGAPVNEGRYRFLDDRTYSITTTNDNAAITTTFVIESIGKDELVVATDENRRIAYRKAK